MGLLGVIHGQPQEANGQLREGCGLLWLSCVIHASPAGVFELSPGPRLTKIGRPWPPHGDLSYVSCKNSVVHLSLMVIYLSPMGVYKRPRVSCGSSNEIPWVCRARSRASVAPMDLCWSPMGFHKKPIGVNWSPLGSSWFFILHKWAAHGRPYTNK